eukprot:9499070-Pyramimonas_sp.AAC.2
MEKSRYVAGAFVEPVLPGFRQQPSDHHVVRDHMVLGADRGAQRRVQSQVTRCHHSHRPCVLLRQSQGCLGQRRNRRIATKPTWAGKRRGKTCHALVASYLITSSPSFIAGV